MVSALDVAGVSYVRGGRTILGQVDLTVDRGEHWALLGPNGAGKTTLLRLLGAQQFPSRGTVNVLGRQLGTYDLRELRRSIGFVDPRHDLHSNLDALQIVLTGVTSTLEQVPHWTPSTDEVERAQSLVKLLGLDAEPVRWRTMSQGERGRALIARALMTAPELLLLDEPSTGLDLAAREQMIQTIAELPAALPGLTSVTVTHHFEELPPSVSHACLLRGGQCGAAGPVHEVLTTELVTTCFAHRIAVEHRHGCWSARAH
ncbi:MAG: ATP-binding cassette domain-containing protein [Nocardioidaceae bacterium]|nr:ATP-binding cassette domain-containing protein [Nocardioidaceae bacterium]